ncbi:glutaredoxin [Dipodascopsis tothii]|uniref:glutaredoxin n=1 Tax=Dipodascopsis tothii TaxID=44089 RepID=UPI0034CF6040
MLNRLASAFTRSFSSTASFDMASVQTKVQALINENSVMVFSKTWCPYCRQAKATLEQKKAGAKVVELDHEDDGEAIQAALTQITKQRTVPYVFIGGKLIGGNSDLQALNKQGGLEPLLKEISA